MVSKRSTQYITWNRAREPEVFYVDGDYDAEFIADLKEYVPKGARTWDSANRRWIIQKEYLHIVKQLALNNFNNVYYSEGGDFVRL